MSEAVMIERYVQRIVSSLPYHTGASSLILEQDQALHHARRALEVFSQGALPPVLAPLLKELETLTKPPYYAEADFVSLDLLRSQLFLLRVVANCLVHHWAAHDTSRRSEPSSSTTSSSSKIPPTPGFVDPSPLEDALARQLLSLALSFLKTHSLHEDDLGPLAVSSASGPMGLNASVAYLAQAALRTAVATQSTGRPSLNGFVSSATVESSREGVRQEFVRYAGKVLYFLSASNWSIVLARIKNRFNHYTTSDDVPEPGDLRILECCCLDRRRLSIVIQDLCTTYIHLKRAAQSSVSLVLRRAIMSWIESFGGEFAALTTSGRRLEGGPEVLFDIICSLSEGSKKKTYAWPAMNMLLILCPDILARLAVGDDPRAPGMTKKAQYFESLRKALRGAKLADVAAAAYGDLCKAATYTEPDASDPSALRMLVADLDSDVKSKLFDSTRPFLTAEGLPATSLTTQILVSMYRLEPSSVIQSAFTVFLQNGAHEMCKMAATNACLVLFREGQSVPWSPSAIALLPAIAKPLRHLFLDTVKLDTDSNGSNGRPSFSRNGNRFGSDDSSHRIELLMSILSIWRADLRFLTHGVYRPPIDAPANQPGSHDSLGKVLLALTGLFDESNVRVRLAATATLLELDRSEVEEVGKTRDGLFEHSALAVSFAISKHVVEAKWDSTEERLALELLLHDLMRYQALFESSPPPQAIALLAQPGWPAHWTSIEIALLVSLNSSESANRALAVLCLQRAITILDASERLGYNHGRPAAQKSTTTIREFAAVFAGHAGMMLELENHQSKARGVLSKLEVPTAGLLAAWDEAMRRWKELSAVIFSRVAEDDTSSTTDAVRRDLIEASKTPEQQFQEWTNLSGFLLAGSNLLDGRCDALDLILPPSTYPTRFFRSGDRFKQVERLIQELVDLLVSDSIDTRDAVRELLGNDLSGRQLPPFVAHLKQITKHFFDEHTVVTEDPFTVFIEQAMSVLQLVFARPMTTLPREATTTLDGLLLSFALYIQRLELKSEALRLKTSLCQLCEVILAQREPSHHDAVVRNKLLERLVGWTLELQVPTDDAPERLRGEFNTASLKAMAALTDGLLVSKDEPFTKQTRTDTRLFKRYHEFFAHSLSRLAHADSSTASHRHRGTKSNGGTTARAQTGAAAASRRVLVSSLANLLSANIESAYTSFPEMGLNPDPAVRTAYLETLIKVVEKGTKLDALSRLPDDDTFAQLVSLLRGASPLAVALCEVCPAAHFEDLIDVLLKVNSRRSIQALLKAIIEVEVSSTDHESTLFRGNSFATRILTVYARSQGYHWLRNTLKDLLLALCQKPPEFSMDFDPHRQTAADDDASRNLEQVTEAFLVCISQSIDQVPPAIREICSHIGEVVGERFPESVFTAIGGFVFLRFINPAIVSPETIDLDLPANSSTGETRDIRRGLVMITKVLQALANNVRFGSKEPGMKKLNEFMDVNIFTMTRFLSAVSHFNTAEESFELLNDTSDDPDSALDEADRSFLHQFLADNSAKLGVELLHGKHTSRQGQNGADSSLSSRSDAWAKVTELIATLGPPDQGVRQQSTLAWDSTPEQAYRAFITRNASRSTSDAATWERVFYSTSGNKTGVPTFCLLLHRVKAETADIESLLCFMLTTLDKIRGNYEIFIDATRFSPKNEISPAWITQLLSIVPPALASRLTRIILFSANPRLKQFIRKVARTVSFESLDSRRVVAVSTLAELEGLFTSIESLLPSSTLSLAREKRSIFSQITHRHQIRVEHPVLFRIGQRTLVISTAKKQDLFSDVKCVLDDVIDLGDVEEVRKVSVGVEGDGVLVQVAGEKAPRRFLVSARRDELFTALNAARTGVPTKPSLQIRDLQPDECLATLINAILFNLASSNDSLRSLAHTLLCSLARSLAVDNFEDLRTSKGLYLPGGHLAFLSGVSERLAAAFPSHSLGVFNQFASALSTLAPGEGSAYVHCLRPWLHNLHALAHVPRDERKVVQVKLRRFVRQLLNASVRDSILHSALSSRVWPAVGKLDALIPLLLDESVRLATSFDFGSDSDPTERIGEVFVALGAGIGFRGKVLARLRQVIARTAIKPVSTLAQSPEFAEIVALLRFDLALSFESKQQSQLFLPEIMHVAVSLVGTGPLVVRKAVLSLLVNTLHSLLREPEADIEALAGTMAILVGDESDQLFALSDSDGALPVWTLLVDGERLVGLLVDVMESAAPSLDTSNAWRARWTSLSTASSFQHNPSIQARAFLVLSYLGAAAVDGGGDLVFQILTTLRGCIRLSPTNDLVLVQSILRTLVSTLPGLAADSPFWPTLCWIGISVLQIGSPVLSAAAVSLLSVIVDTMGQAGYFAEQTLLEVLLDFRDGDGPEACANQLDDAAGVDCEGNLGFSVATLLARGLQDSTVVTETTTLLFQLVGVSRPRNEADRDDDLEQECLGLFLLLWPLAIRAGRTKELLTVAGFDDLDPSNHSAIAARLAIPHQAAALLAYSLCVRVITLVVSDDERLALLAVLARLGADYPDVAASLHCTLSPVLRVASASSNLEVLDAVQRLVRSQARQTSIQSTDDSVLGHLAQLGFPALAGDLAYTPEELAGTITTVQVEVSMLASELIANALNSPPS